MKLSIRALRAAGLTDAQILLAIEEQDAERREKWRIQKRNQRSCPQSPQDKADIADIADKVDTALIPVRTKEKGRKKNKSPLPDDWVPKRPPRDATELEEFKNSAKAHDRRYADWDAAWANWQTSQFNKRNGRQGNGTHRQGNSAIAALGKLRERFEREAREDDTLCGDFTRLLPER